jgi:hypothetical protein
MNLGISFSSARPDKRMHPTADTTILKFLQSLGAARDARRWVAHYIVSKWNYLK